MNTVTGQRRVEIDVNVGDVLEFMRENIPANRLISVAECLPAVARLLWSNGLPQEPCIPLVLTMEKPTRDLSQHNASE
jgi:hypothetical protein